jgi:DNA (cytosine-5)-methyltransferase 1
MMPRILDLFCGAGGAAVGYARAGFEVVGVDIKPQPNYPFEFIQNDAIGFMDVVLATEPEWLASFDAVHASPPCQGYSPHVTSRSSRWVPTKGKDEARLIATVRDHVGRWGVPYVIENVMGARSELVDPTLLCGTMFGLPIARHRLFESNVPLWPSPGHPQCNGVATRYAVTRGWEARDMTVTGKGRHAGTSARWGEIMGVDWPMTQHEMAESIPPAFTQWVGEQLLSTDAVRARRP